jgi:hypothetical protein
MSSLRNAGLVRQWSTVLLTITAWVLLSNHCALGLSGAAAGPESEAGACPMHSAPAKKKPPTNLLCCKTLRALAPQAVKSVVAVTISAIAIHDYVTATLVIAPPVSLQSLPLDTGPPYLRTFAETILQRCLLAHAPPSTLATV